MRLIRILFFTFFVLLTNSLSAQYYVDQSATGTNDGSSWTDAFTSVHDALEVALISSEVWVAAGTYLPGYSSEWTGVPRLTFYIHQNVMLYGGFNGTETDKSQRDPLLNLTILSGDMNGDDDASDLSINRLDNAFNVLYMESTVDNYTVVDGFTISGGNAIGDTSNPGNRRGGGIWTLGSPQIKDCHFIENFAAAHGGALYLRDAAAVKTIVDRCSFDNNLAGFGGGGMTVSTVGSMDTVSISNCQFTNNRSTSFGAGLHIFQSNVKASSCSFSNNSTVGKGGGLYLSLDTNNECTFELCTLSNNKATKGAGCAVQGISSASSKIEFISCNFIDNQTEIFANDLTHDGGGLYMEFYNEDAKDNVLNIRDCLFQNNTAREGAAITANHFGGSNNALHINHCEFLSNHSEDVGGVQVMDHGADSILTTIHNSMFSENTGDVFQAVAQKMTTPGTNNQMDLMNCIFHDNGVSDPLKSVVGNESIMHIKNCTFLDNNTAINILDAGSLTIQNTILASKFNDNVILSDASLVNLVSNGGNLIDDNSLNAWLGPNDQSATVPEFANNSFMFTEGSPGIDQGIIFEDIPLFDFNGNDRIQGGCIDVGAIESNFDSGTNCITSTNNLIDDSGSLVLFPNPINNTSRLTIENSWEGMINVSVVNILGENVYHSIVRKTESKITLDLNIPRLPKSSYYLIISNEEARAVKQFVKW